MRWLSIRALIASSLAMSATGVGVSAAPEQHAKALEDVLSPGAKVYYPNSTEFTTLTTRWSALAEPKVNVAVVPAVEDDVVKTVGGFFFLSLLLISHSPGSLAVLSAAIRLGAATYATRVPKI